MNEQQRRASVVLIMVAVLAVLGIAVLAIVPFQRDDAAVLSLSEPVPALVFDINAVYDPEAAGEPLPQGYRQLLGRDQIKPVYDPVFATADQVDWPSDSLVIGVSGSETAKAYPVTHLNQREMVIDHLEGMPILVSW